MRNGKPKLDDDEKRTERENLVIHRERARELRFNIAWFNGELTERNIPRTRDQRCFTFKGD